MTLGFAQLRQGEKKMALSIEDMQTLEERFKNIAVDIVEKKLDEREKIITIGRSDLNELKYAVKDLEIEQKGMKVDINDLKGIVKELAEAQKETQKETGRLDKTMQELAEAQKQTDIAVKELTQAQKKTEEELQKLIQEVRIIAGKLDNTNTNLGGLSKSVSYSLENEAFRVLPAYLKEKYGIEIIDKFVRKDIEGEEINIFARAKKDDKELFIVGETVLKLDSVSEITQLKIKAQVIENKYNKEIIKLLITHYAKQFILEKANKDGIIVIQSFEW